MFNPTIQLHIKCFNKAANVWRLPSAAGSLEFLNQDSCLYGPENIKCDVTEGSEDSLGQRTNAFLPR